MGTFKVFFESDFSEFQTEHFNKLRLKISDAPEVDILDLTPEQEQKYIQHVVDEYTIEPIVIDFDSVEALEKEVKADSGNVQTFTVCIPFEGDDELLRRKPCEFQWNTTQVWIEKQRICFHIYNRNNDASGVSNAMGKRRHHENRAKTIPEGDRVDDGGL